MHARARAPQKVKKERRRHRPTLSLSLESEKVNEAESEEERLISRVYDIEFYRTAIVLMLPLRAINDARARASAMNVRVYIE